MATVKDYFSSLSKEQKQNIHFIINEMLAAGITNHYTMAAILSIVSKETNFIPQVEKDYSQTDIVRIRTVFRKKVAGLSDAKINALKSNPVEWFNFLYGGRNGNAANEGFKYRGRFFNQLTFKNSYVKIGKQIGIDIATDPDKYVQDVVVSAKVLIQYYKNNFTIAKTTELFVDDNKTIHKSFASHYGTADINGFKDLSSAVIACYHCNAGLGRTIAYINADHTKGLKKAMGRAATLLKIVQEQTKPKNV